MGMLSRIVNRADAVDTAFWLLFNQSLDGRASEYYSRNAADESKGMKHRVIAGLVLRAIKNPEFRAAFKEAVAEEFDNWDEKISHSIREAAKNVADPSAEPNEKDEPSEVVITIPLKDLMEE